MMVKLTHRTRFASRGIVLAAVAVVMAACSSASDTGSTSTPTTNQQSTPRSPATTTDSDWKSVTDTLGRTGKPEDIVGPAIFLASDLAAYVTGTIVMADGGYRAI